MPRKILLSDIRLPIFDVGFEVEFFLTQSQHVYNASKVMERALGFSVDQNNPSAGVLKLGDGYELGSDGTAAELRYFQPGMGNLPDNVRDRISRVQCIAGYGKCFRAHIRAGDLDGPGPYGTPTEFVEPGHVYASEKEMINAYTNIIRVTDKKWETDHITSRTAGLHLHFSLTKNVPDKVNSSLFGHGASRPDLARKHTNELVKILDRLYDELFVRAHLSVPSQRRASTYQTLGEYRIRKAGLTQSGRETLEYRQLDAEMFAFNLSGVQRLINTFQFAALEYIREHVRTARQ